MEYTTYTFRKEIPSVRKGFSIEAQQHLQPLEQICQETGGINFDGWVETPGSDHISGPDIYRRTTIFLVDKVLVRNRVHLSHADRGEQSSVETTLTYRQPGVDIPPVLDKIQNYYQTKPAFRYNDSEKRLAGESLVPQGLERKR